MGLSGYEESGDLFEVVSPDGNNVLYDEIEMPWNAFIISSANNVIYLILLHSFIYPTPFYCVG